MKLRSPSLPIVAALWAMTIASPVVAQHRDTAATRSGTVRAAADLRTRIDETEARIAEGESSRTITRSQATGLRQRIVQMRRSVAQLSRRQGVVSTAERATYDRTLASIGVQLDHAGVPRGYGNDALPSAEMIAFRKTDARLHYRGARVEYDGNNCAVYQGEGPDGRVRREPLKSSAGQPICVRR